MHLPTSGRREAPSDGRPKADDQLARHHDNGAQPAAQALRVGGTRRQFLPLDVVQFLCAISPRDGRLLVFRVNGHERAKASTVGIQTEGTIEASACRRSVDQSEIRYWQENIAKHQAELMEVQTKIASTNKVLRTTNVDDRRKVVTAVLAANNDEFYTFFYQITRDSIDPRQFEALERDARQLLTDYQRMNGGG